MTSERNLPITMESIAEDVIKQHGTRPSDIDLATRKVEEAATRRYEAAAWLRRTIGVVGAKDLPEEPSEEEFRIGLRNGIILCNVINKVQPGSIPKVVEVPIDSNVIPDGAPLSAYQHFENVRNFLVTLEHMGIPTFEASDLEKGGKSSRVVNSVLALKLYNDYKQAGKYSSSKFGGITRPSNLTKHFIRKGSDPFMNFFSQTQALPGKLSDDLHFEDVLSGDLLIQSTGMKSSNSLSMIRTALSYTKSEEVPLFVDALLHKVMQEYERRIPIQKEMIELQGNISKSKEEESTIKEKAKNELKQSNVKQHEMSLEVRELKERIKIMEQLKLEAKPFQERLLPQQHKATTIEKNDLKEMEEKILNDLEEKPNIERLKKQQAKEIKQKALKENLIKQQLLVDHQQKQIQELKCVHQFAKSSMEYLKTYYLKEFDNLANQLCVIANAASGYHKVLEENRKLYNQIQDLKGNIRVYCRVRPFLAGQMSNMSTIVHMDDQNITICSPLKTGKDARRNFTFNKVYGPSATQEEIFLDTQPLIRSVLDGYNVCIFAYGQTGSGKTHTMSGPDELNEKTMGVNYRALNDLFYLSEQRKHTFTYAISVQMVEIYNDQVRDLLNDDSNKRLEIRNCSNKGLSVPGANLVPVSSTEEVIEIMNMGQKNRAVCYTAMNDRSSRSHSCLSIHVQGKEKRSGTAVRGSMHLVDLAGSERVEKSEVKGERLREAQHINKSLSALGDVIACLAQKSAHVPYRNSKLTQLLQDSLGGQAKTLMFVHVSPEVEALGETISTLKFAERVASVELGAARVNRDCGEVRDLKEQIAALKMELERKGSAELEDEFEELQIKKPNYKRAEDLQSLEEETKSAEWIDKAVVNNSKGGGGGDEEAVKEMRRVFYADDSDHSSAAGESSKLRRPQAKGIKSVDGIGRNLSHASRNGSTQTVVKTKRSGGIKNSGK